MTTQTITVYTSETQMFGNNTTRYDPTVMVRQTDAGGGEEQGIVDDDEAEIGAIETEGFQEGGVNFRIACLCLAILLGLGVIGLTIYCAVT
eukprot:CAMPEP_0116550802 /NCGR_PEP_ID=MMETSP0397-20121206/5622_1 /TAXON_ID=216820 /ORGANISM="Cyclophora tenuis, Strain ECT3854" /LENGTH=90 /DNA_ID=CAMNT_0004075659 /DNA_START=446 /DNA_END=715 /DNA_ORIENTATION=+